jgi:hypothetical protein
MEMENELRNVRGIAGTGLGLGAGALGVSLLNGSLGNIFGGCGCNGNAGYYSRYDAEKDARIANLETEVKLRDANTYTDQKLLEVYSFVNRKFDCIEHELADQRVYNAVNTTTIGCVKNDVAELMALTKMIIPASSICPPVMPQFNSWVAPTTTTTTG